ncbi:MAG: AmmeMemoRadiSam system protein A [Persicimonas sp.]
MSVKSTAVDTSQLDPRERRRALALAHRSIRHGLERGRPPRLTEESRRGTLAEERASFVSVRVDGKLNGCIGSLEASRPLADDVVDNAFKAAFRDPRFAPLNSSQLEETRLEISVLSPLRRIEIEGEEELVEHLRPGVDGLVLVREGRRGTLLPSVWDKCPEPARFVALVKKKAGLPVDRWDERIEAYRYTVESFDDAE